MQRFKTDYQNICSININDAYKFMLGALIFTGLTAGLITADAQELSENDIYSQAPSPQEIADKLYKPRYRSIVINNDTVQEKEENLFAMLINFEFDSTKILPRSYPLLDSVGQMMNLESVGQQKIVIEGHTDTIGDGNYNLTLSQRRAQAIKEYLENRYNVAPERMVITGKGESEPYDVTNPKNEVNRRVQFRPQS